jgi:HTH-type transcriptional regulator, quorum sensing regulator NprR
MNSVGDRLREARLARGWTQGKLAEGLATKGFISQVERNRATPSLAKLRLMAERLQLPLGHFTGDRLPMEVSYLRKSAALAVKAKEPERALALVEEAASQLTTANERADLLRIKGTAYEALTQFDDALAACQAAAAAAPPDDPELNAAIYVEIGYILTRQEHFVSAVEAYMRGLQWLDRTKLADPGLRARLLTNLGRAHWSMGHVDRAHSYLASALEAATDAESLWRIANAHMGLGITARAKGQLDEALEHCNRALEIHARIRQERDANQILNNIGDVHYSAGRLAEAREFQQRCLVRGRELKDDFAVGVAAGALARYDLDENHLGDAIAHAREARLASKRDRDHLHEALAAAMEGEAADRQGNTTIANRKFAFAMRLLHERDAAAKLAEVCAMYGEALRRRGQDDRAFSFMRMAAERDFGKLRTLLTARP